MKVLFLTQIWPERSASGASTRTLQLVCFLSRQGWNLHVWSDADQNEHERALQESGCLTLRIGPNDPSFDEHILALKPDVVIFDRFSMEEKFSFRVWQHCPSALRILDTVDLHSLRIARGKRIEQEEKQILCCPEMDLTTYLQYSEGTWERELAAIMRSDLILVVSDVEQNLLCEKFHVPRENVVKCRLSYPSRTEAAPGFEDRMGFVALGSFQHPPNVDAFKYLHQYFWPKLRERMPHATLNIWGSHMTPKHLQNIAPQKGITVNGYAPCAISILEKARVHLALVRYGAGIKSKISDAFYAFTPSITTQVGAEGMLDGHAFPGFIARTLDEAIENAITLHEEKSAWEEASSKCEILLKSAYSEESTLNHLGTLISTTLSKLEHHRFNHPLGRLMWHQSLRSTEYFSRWIEAKQSLAQLGQKAHTFPN